MMGEGCGQDKRETLGRNDEGWQQEVKGVTSFRGEGYDM